MDSCHWKLEMLKIYGLPINMPYIYTLPPIFIITLHFMVLNLNTKTSCKKKMLFVYQTIVRT